MANHYDVIIVGAGLAGCSAAKRLVDEGVSSILLLEASEQVGGRVKTLETEYGTKLELGAHWIHGSDRNPLYDLANQHGLVTYKQEYFNDSRSNDQNGVHFKMYNSPKKLMDQKLLDEAYEIYEALTDRISEDWDPDDCSIEEFKKKHMLKLCKKYKCNDERCQQHESFLKFMEDSNSSDEATWPNDLSSLICDVPYDDCGGKNYVFKDGTYSLFSTIFLPLIEDKIKLNSEVSCIDWSSSTVNVSTTSGESYTADHVVITPSLGYMKEKHLELLKPQLPSDKCEALDGLAFGIAEKIVLLFDDPFWKEDLKKCHKFSGFSFIFNQADLESLSAMIEEIIGPNDGWWRAMPFLDVLKTIPNGLLTWLCGQAAVSMHKYSEDQVKQVILTIINYYTGIEKDQQCKLIRTKWQSNPYTRGSYSRVLKDYDPKYSSVMLEPLFYGDKPMVMFAGEAYHPSFMTTMHAAYVTGLQQANVILDYMDD